MLFRISQGVRFKGQSSNFGILRLSQVDANFILANSNPAGSKAQLYIRKCVNFQFPYNRKVLSFQSPSNRKVLNFKFPSNRKRLNFQFPSKRKDLKFKFPSNRKGLNFKFPSNSKGLSFPFPFNGKCLNFQFTSNRKKTFPIRRNIIASLFDQMVKFGPMAIHLDAVLN